MATAVLALGANQGDPARQLADAIDAIGNHRQITLVRQSTVIVTPPWGKTDQADFLNAAVVIETDLEPLELLDFCLETEAAIGRVRLEKWGPRMIDIDVIAYNRDEIASDRLTVPHPLAHERAFVLDPVREIAPDVADWLVNRIEKKSG